MTFLADWAATLGAAPDDTWFTTVDASVDASGAGVLRGRAADPLLVLLQVTVAGGVTTGVHVDLVTPVPLAELEAELGVGDTVHAADATSPTVVWRRGTLLVAADVGPAGAFRLSLTETAAEPAG